MLRAGVAQVDITPAVGFDSLSGFPRYCPATGVVDRAWARALVLDDGQCPLAIVTADVLWFTSDLVAAIRGHVERLTGIPGGHLLLNASHSHTPPETYPAAGASESYVTEFAKQMAGAVYMAWQDLQPAAVGHGRGEARVNINRYRFGDGPWTFQPAPDEPIDHGVPVLRVDRADGRPLAVMAGFACHPSILPAEFSHYCGDYTAPLQATMARLVGQGAMPMFLAGAGGDVKVAVTSDDGERFVPGTLDDCRRSGAVVGAEAARVALGIQCQPVCRLGAVTSTVTLQTLPPVSEAEFRRQAAELPGRNDRSGMDDRVLEWLEEGARQVALDPGPRIMEAPLQLLTIGDEISLLGVPGELFTAIGLRLQEALGVPGPFVAAYCNDTLSVGYLPSRRAVEHGWSDNDVNLRVFQRPCLPANYDANTEDRLIAATRAMVEAQRAQE